jgi:hypothetical protein
MKKFTELKQKINWWHILILLVIFISMMVCMRYTAAQVKKISAGIAILDLNFGNSIEFIRQTITLLGESARNYYLTKFFVVDGFYSLTYAAFYAITLLFLFNKIGIKKKIVLCLPILPIIGMLFDWAENLSFGIAIKYWDIEITSLYVFGNICTIIKFIFVYSSLFLVVSLLICFIVKCVKQKKESKNIDN